MGVPTQPGLWSDSFADFSLGVNTNLPAIALPRNQMASATNCTVRGNFVKHRPPFRHLDLEFASADIESAFATGLFQGACAYVPDFGNTSLICSISGKFYLVTPVGTSALVTDISAADDGVTDAQQFWLWQGENFCFINDGTNPTAIYDGATTVRAYQGEVVGTISNTWTVPAPGASVAITLAADYEGPMDKAVYVYNGAQLLGTFEVNAQSSSTGYKIRLTNVDDVQGAVQPTASEIKIINSWNATTTSAGTPTSLPYGNPILANATQTKLLMQQDNAPPFTSYPYARSEYQKQTFNVTPAFTGVVGSRVVFPALNRETVGFTALECIVVSITNGGNTIRVQRADHGNDNQEYVAIPSGASVRLMNAGNDQVIAITTAPFTAPAVGAFIDASVDRQVTVNGQVVYVNGKRYTATNTPIVPTTSLFLKGIYPRNVGDSIAPGVVIRTIPQLPPGRYGVYGMGRDWVSLPDGRSYMASDLVGSSSGSQAYNYRDAILNITENNYLAGGGVFRVPGSGLQINSMAFPATLDSSLGQGPLQILTQNIVFSCNAPVDRLQWQDLVNPIQTQSLIGAGALGDVVTVSGDLWFRASDGIRSLRLARQEFQTSWANTPQSIEMAKILSADNQILLNFWHGIVFDNRLVTTANPQTAERGVYHDKLIALNLDPNSGLQGKQPPVYDGVWTGLNVLRICESTFSGVKKSYAFTYEDGEIGFAEYLTTPPDGATFNLLDDGDQRILWGFESPALFCQRDTRNREQLRLTDGEIFVKDLVGDVQFSVYYKPDWLDEWTLWHNWSISDSPSYQPRMGLGTPTTTGNAATQQNNAVGYHFQIKVVILGSCTVLGGNFYAATQPKPAMSRPIPNTAALTSLDI